MDSEKRALVEQHKEAGTCYLCAHPIVWGTEGVYSPTGAHYDCEWPNGQPNYREVLGSLVQSVDRLIDDMGLRPTQIKPRPARANGGGLIHYVRPKTGKALCGHAPKNTAWHMKRRGKWNYFTPDKDFSKSRFCEECNRLHEGILAGKFNKRIPRSR